MATLRTDPEQSRRAPNLRSVVVGTGSSLPERVVTNADLAERVDTSDEWIVQRTGIRQRHIAAPHETTSVLGTRAAQAALDHAGLGPADIDLVVCATSTPDYTFPSTATQIQAALGIEQGFAAAVDLAHDMARHDMIRTIREMLDQTAALAPA